PAVVAERSAAPARVDRVTTDHERGQPVERGHELAQLPGRREVLVLVRYVHGLHAIPRVELGDDGLDEVLGGAGTGGDADDADAGQLVDFQLVGPVDAQDDGTSGAPRDLREGHGVGRVGAADHD